MRSINVLLTHLLTYPNHKVVGRNFKHQAPSLQRRNVSCVTYCHFPQYWSQYCSWLARSRPMATSSPPRVNSWRFANGIESAASRPRRFRPDTPAALTP